MLFSIKIILLGIFSTVAIDIWATFSNKVLNIPRTNWGMVGRWLGHIPKGVYFHGPISSSPAINHELVIGWAFHYLIGITYAALYVATITLVFESHSTLPIAVGFGLLTILSPWFIMQPALGLGVCAHKASKPNLVRFQNFAIHTIFGVALYFGWVGLNA